MGMEVNPISAQSTYSSSTVTKTEKPEKKETDTSEVVATFEKTAETPKKATYSINKMSDEDRANLVSKLKEEQNARESQLMNLVSDMLGKQGKAFATANDMWKFLASGNYEVDAATKAQAQADIAEDGFYGVKQTSQRMFDFACALAGDDEEKMKKMQSAVQKGYEMAQATWGGALPDICQKTMDATNKLFDDYFASKENE